MHVLPVVTYSVYSQHSCISKCCLLCQQFTDAMPKKKMNSLNMDTAYKYSQNCVKYDL